MKIDVEKSTLVCRFRGVEPRVFPRMRARIAMWIFEGIGGTVEWDTETAIEKVDVVLPTPH